MASLFHGADKPIKGRGGFDTDYVHYMELEKVADGFDPKDPSNFIIQKDVVEYERLPIDEYLAQFAPRVGLKNMLQGVLTQQQMEEFIAAHQAPAIEVDATKLPNNDLDMEKLVGSIDKIWASIPDELKGDLTKEEFLKSFTADKLTEYIASQVSSTEEKGESKE